MSANTPQKSSRRQQILECLAHELEKNPGARITTASLAKAVGISEAALYRHFPSKAKMFEALIEFSEDTIFGIATRIQNEQTELGPRCEAVLKLLLGFSERNPGISRILIGDALVGEHERLRARVAQFYERLETQLKQFIRDSALRGEIPHDVPAAAIANLLITVVEGKMNQYVRSEFKRKPLEHWSLQWANLEESLMFNRNPEAAIA